MLAKKVFFSFGFEHPASLQICRPFHLRSYFGLIVLRLFLLLTVLVSLSCTSKKNPAQGPATEKKTVNLFIWANYLSDESLKEFEKESNLKLNVTHFASNEELLAKLQAGASGYDVIVPSDYMVAALIQLQLLEPLNKTLISNISNLDTQYLGKEYDPKNEFSLPYGWSTTGIAFNKKLLPEGVKGWKELLELAKLKGHVGLLDDTREVFAAALKLKGQSVNTTDEKILTDAKNYLEKNKSQIKAFNSDPIESILGGEVWATQMYSSDALQAGFKSGGQIEYVIPSEGCTMAIDNLAIPKSAQNKEGAHALINYLISKENNLRFVQKMFAGPVLTSTKDKLTKELQANSGLFPSSEVRLKMEMIKDVGAATALYDRLWTEFKTH